MLTLYAQDSRRKIKEKQLLCRFQWQERLVRNEKTLGLPKKRQSRLPLSLCRSRWFFWRRNHLRREQLSQQEQPEHKQGTVPDFLPHLLATLHLISSFSPKTQKVLSPLSAGSLNNDNFKRLQKALKKLESHPGCTAGLCRHSMWSQSENLVVFLFGFCLRDELQLPTHTHTHTIKTTPAHVWPEAKRQHVLLQPCWPWCSSLC